jgi:hypothetical protein
MVLYNVGHTNNYPLYIFIYLDVSSFNPFCTLIKLINSQLKPDIISKAVNLQNNGDR